MTLYRIHADDTRYLNFVVDSSDVRKNLGKDCVFHMDRRPRSYAHVWKTPILIDFHYGRQGKNKSVPDIAVINGRLYFGEDAYRRLHTIIDAAGEFLPVHHPDGTGFVFNPLKTAEEVDGIDEAKTAYDPHGNLAHYAFQEDRVKDFPMFRTEMDTYQGVFCHDAFKEAVEAAGFKGVLFGRDYSNPIGVAFGSTH